MHDPPNPPPPACKLDDGRVSTNKTLCSQASKLSPKPEPRYPSHEQQTLQGYLAKKKTPTPLGLPWDPRHGPTVGS